MIILMEWNNMGLISGDSRGQLFSLDLLFALIPLVLVLGIVASDMDNIMYLVEDTVFHGSTDRVAADTVNALLETSGTPPTWEQNNASNRIVGLAPYDNATNRTVEGKISTSKLSTLTANDVQNLVGDKYDYFMNVSTINDDGTYNTSLKVLGTYNNTVNDIVRVEKVALSYKYETVTSLTNVMYTGQTRTYTTSFQTNYFYNQSYNYWVLMLTDAGFNPFTSATVNINNNPMNLGSSTLNKNSATLINSSFLKANSSDQAHFYDNIVTLNVTGSSFGSSMDLFIVQTPKGMVDSSDVNGDTVKPKKCRFVFCIWAK